MSGMNKKLQMFGPLKDQCERVTTVKDGLLAIHSGLGAVYAQLDTAEAARVSGGIDSAGFQALRQAIDKAIQAVDYAVAVAVPQLKTAIGALADIADEVNAAQISLQRGFAAPSGSPTN